MKKIIALVLVLVCMLCLVGCNADKQGELKNDDVTDGFTFIVIEASEEHLLVAEIGEDGNAIEAKQYSVPNVFHSDKIAVGEKMSLRFPNYVGEVYCIGFSDEG